MEILKLKNGYIAFRLTDNEVKKAGFTVNDMVYCAECGKAPARIYYVPVWNEVMCKSCLDEFEEKYKMNEREMVLEQGMIGKLIQKLGGNDK